MNRILALGIFVWSGWSLGLTMEPLKIRHEVHSLDFSTSEEWTMEDRNGATPVLPMTEAVAETLKAMTREGVYHCEGKVWKHGSAWPVYELRCK